MNSKPIPVILDTDIGGDIDDTWALGMLLKCPELDLKMVLSDTGDTIYRSKIAAKLLEIANRTDVTVGIGINQGKTDMNQGPWIEGYDLAAYPGKVHENGVEALVELIMNYPESMTLICIGPAPNLAKALEIEPKIASKCRFVGMHGSIDRGYGREDPEPEYNVKADVPAARKVFAAPWQDITITPLDTCGKVVLEGEKYQKVKNSKDPVAQAVIENYLIWAKRAKWTEGDFAEHKSSTLFDTVAVYLAYSDELLKMERLNISVADDGLTFRAPEGHEMNAALEWKDLPAFEDHLVDRLTS